MQSRDLVINGKWKTGQQCDEDSRMCHVRGIHQIVTIGYRLLKRVVFFYSVSDLKMDTK